MNNNDQKKQSTASDQLIYPTHSVVSSTQNNHFQDVDKPTLIQKQSTSSASTLIVTPQLLKEGSQIEIIKKKYPQSAWRWVNLICFFLALAAITSVQTTFTPISSVVAQAYGVSQLMVNTCTIAFFVCYIIFNFPSIIALEADKVGERSGRAMMLSLKISATLVIACAWGRYFLARNFENFAPILIPSFMMAVLYPFFLNSMGKFVCVWFGDGQRAIALSLCSLSMAGGTICGLVFGPLYIKEKDKDSFEDCREHVIQYMLFAAILITAMNVPIILLFKAYPKEHPSKSAEENDTDKEMNELKPQLQELMKNRNYIILMVIFCLQYSVYLALGAVINTLVEPFDYSPMDATIVGVAFVFSGIVGSMVFSFILDMYQCYLLLLKMITMVTTIAICFVYYTLPAKNTYALAVNLGFLGFFNVPIIPIGFSLCTEITYPISVALAQGIFLMTTQIYGTAISYASTYIIEQGQPLIVVAMVVVQFAVSMILTCFVKEDLRRLKIGQANMVENTGSQIKPQLLPLDDGQDQQNNYTSSAIHRYQQIDEHQLQMQLESNNN